MVRRLLPPARPEKCMNCRSPRLRIRLDLVNKELIVDLCLNCLSYDSWTLQKKPKDLLPPFTVKNT